MCLKQFNKKNFAKVRPLVNILLASNSLSECELYEVVSIAGAVSSRETFQKYLSQLRPLVVKLSNSGGEQQVSLYHPSLAEWFSQTKFCGPAFACNGEDGLTLIKEWKQNKHETTDKPDLVVGLEAREEEEDKMWMLLDTEERRKRKEKVCSTETSGDSRSLVETVRTGDLSQVSRLLSGPAQEEQQEIVSAALVAAREGFPDSLKILLGTGKVEADLTDDNGWTLLRTSSWSGQTDCVQLLLRAGAEVNRADRDRRTALRAACWAGHLECVKELLEAGAEINQMDSEGRTALIAACYMGHLDCVRELIIWGADIEVQDQDGRTALSVAVTCESESAAK